MRTSTVIAIQKPLSITVRHYETSVVNIYSDKIIKDQEAGDFEIGQFRLKYLNKIPKEYGKTINFEDKLNH
jgi:hypothetical protein